MTASVDSLINDTLTYQYNPAAIQRTVLQVLSDVTNKNIEVVDPTTPFVFALESASCLTAAYMNKNQANTRKQYPSVAQTPEDLYNHMSDKDYMDRFAVPAKAIFTLIFQKDEVLSRMVTDESTGIRKITLPRNTFFMVADTVFSLQYPIEIRQLAHGGIQILYINDIVSPLQTLETNFIDYTVSTQPNGDYLVIEVEAQQFSIISQNGTLNSAVDFTTTITIDDQYYYTRVYTKNSNGGWTEIKTTHSDQVYDINTPTAVIKVVDKLVNISIPQIYTSSGMLNSSLRMDVYQTKGPLNMILWEYPQEAFVATWMNYDVNDNTIFTAPLKSFRNITIYSDQAVSGGRNALTFEELRKRVIANNTGAPDIPITNNNISSTLNDLGYNVVKNIDNITNRVFLATRGMPDPTTITNNDGTPISTSIVTPASASMETISFTFNEAASISSNIDNGSTIVLTPNTLYKNVNGVTSMVSSEELAWLLGLPIDKRAAAVTTGGYLYTPFHYVVDTGNEEFDNRAYFLDDPIVKTKLFVAENDSTLIQVGTAAYGILRNNTGYTIQIVTQSGDSFKALDPNEVNVQLAFIPTGEKDRAYINGVYAGKTDAGESIYNFDLATNFNIDKNDNITLTKFLMYTTEPRLIPTALFTEFDILFTTTRQMSNSWKYSAIDNIIGRFILPTNSVAISHEKLRVQFGYSLSKLWSRARSVISSISYETYSEDVPAVYEADVYQRDGLGSAITFDTGGNPILTVLHKKGDVVLDADGQVVLKHRVGDLVLDNYGQPIPASTRGLLRQIDVMLIEGAYWFATDLFTSKYRDLLTKSVVEWILTDITSISKRLIEQTRLYFYPKTTLGTIDVLVENGLIRGITANQSFQITLYVGKTVNDNEKLKEQLSRTTILTLINELQKTTVSVDGISSSLKQQYGDDVVSVLVQGLGGTTNPLQALTVINDSDRCSLRKRLTPQADGTLLLEEDVTISFVVHEVSS